MARTPEALTPVGPSLPPIVPKVDPDDAIQTLFQLGSTATETGATMQTALNITASPQVESGSIDAYMAKVRQAIALTAQLGTVAASAGGGVPGAGAIRAASNRQFAGASQTG